MRRLGIFMMVCFALAACGGDEATELGADLSGANEVCDDPDACGGDGSGNATIEVDADAGEVCYDISVEGLEGVNASHIHEGEEGEGGDPVIDLTAGLSDEGGSDCVDADEELIQDIIDEPSGFYVNVHTDDLPDGAARGQLSG
jgi:hypothetical protein